MDSITCVELLHTLSELKSLYSEYKDTTGHLKHFFEKHFDYFALKKHDIHLFKFCDETKQIKVHEDISVLQKNIDEKINSLEKGLPNLNIMDPVQETGSYSTVNIQRAYKFNRTKDMDMPTLKRERERLLKLQERHEKRITFLVTELKQTKHNFESMEATLSQERSKFTHIKKELQQASCKNETMTVKADELQILLKDVKKENKQLEEKYHKKKFKCKYTREDLDHTNDQNNIMTIKVEELQVQILEAMTNNTFLEEKYKRESSTYMNTVAEMERHTKELEVELDKALTKYKSLEEKYQNDVSEYKTKHEEMNQNMKELQVHLKQTLTEYKSLEEKYLNIMSDYTRKIEVFDQDIKELQDQLRQALQGNKHLEEKYQDEMSTHEKSRSEFHQSIKELQLQLKQVEKEKKLVEEKYQNEKHTYTKTQTEFELAIYKLQSQLRQTEDIEKEYQDEMYVLQNRKKELEQLVDEYQIEIIKHKKTIEELNKEITDLQVQLNLAEEEKAGLEGKHLNEILTRKELNRAVEELKHQLKQVENDYKYVEQKYEHEFSEHRVTCEELDKTRCEKNTLIEKLKDFEQQRENEMLMKDLQIQQLQTNEKKLEEDLLTQEHAKAENTHCIKNLRDKLHACGVFMRYLLDTRNKLRENLSNKDKFYGEREKRYVKLVNMHIQKQHQARKKFEKMKKSAQTWPQKLCYWWNERVPRHNTRMSSWEEEETSFYPDNWRLPDMGKSHIETSKCNKND